MLRISCRSGCATRKKTKNGWKIKAVTLHGDFAAYYTVNLSGNEDGIASVSVTKALLEAWKIDARRSIRMRWHQIRTVDRLYTQ